MTDFQENWTNARARMANGIEALLCFDMGLTGVELFAATSYILDCVVRPEFEKVLGIEAAESWCVMTLDNKFNKTVIQAGLTHQEAARLLGRLHEEKGYGKHWSQRE